MSDSSASPSRPVSLFTTFCVLVLFAAFFLVVRYYYSPSTTAPFNTSADNFPKDQEWKATSESRRAALRELRETQAKQVGAYGWVNREAGTVQLPIERAIELTAQKYGQKK